MATPFVRVEDGQINLADLDKSYAEARHVSDLTNSTGNIAASLAGTFSIDANGPTYAGALGDGNDTSIGDYVTVELVAGQTYTWSYRGTAEGGIEDPYLALFDTNGEYVTEDDDGGAGRTSQITYTATESGTHYLLASSWYLLDPTAPEFDDVGNYTITQWSPDPALDAPDTVDTTVELSLGTNYAYIDYAGDVDVYAVEVEAGKLYSFAYSGGISGEGDFDGEPGENIAYLDILDADGNIVSSALNYETGTSYFASESGTIYLQVDPYFGTGGYTIDMAEVNPLDYDPLESLNWDSAANIPTVDVDGVPTAYVYFAEAGENFGEVGDDGVTPLETFGWEQFQIDGVMSALNDQYTKITGINYVITDNAEEATFRLLTSESTEYGARFYPQDPGYGTQQGIGTFNLLSGGFGTLPESMDPGGFSYAVVLHEFGHAHGVAHPHDGGGGSEIMLGVAGSSSLGVYDLNQGVYTVMSYNDGWVTHPDGERVFSRANIGDGWSETLSAFDIAVLQNRYGVHEYATGDDVYMLADTQEEASYQTIWDSDGTDAIGYDGDADVRIDLLAATLDYTPTGGGVVSFVDGIFGGYTIANGVVIENAFGGDGDDVILGQDADNELVGRDGDDTIMGRAGDDTIKGGNDNDMLYGDEGNDLLQGGNGLDQLWGGGGDDMLSGGNGKDVLNGGMGSDTLTGGNGPDLFVFDSFGQGAGVDTVSDYQTKTDSVDIVTDGLVQWAQGSAGAELYVDGILSAVFEGVTAKAMAKEYKADVVSLANLSSATADAFVASHAMFAPATMEHEHIF